MKYIAYMVLWFIGAFLINDPRLLWGVTFLLVALQVYTLWSEHETKEK